MSTFILDENPEVIVRIEIQYHRIMKIKPAVIPEDAAWEYVTWDYHESIMLDHGSDTMEHVREIGSGCRITNHYYGQDGILFVRLLCFD